MRQVVVPIARACPLCAEVLPRPWDENDPVICRSCGARVATEGTTGGEAKG
jgi:hypothetical protein